MGNTPQSGGLWLKLGFGARYFQPSSYDILVVFGITYIIINIWSSQISFPTCQVRVVRFYQGALPPRPRPAPRPPPPRLAVLFLLVLLLASSSSFSSTMSASTSTCTSALPTLRPALCQLSSPTLCTKLFANFPAQCAPLDLNLGPFQLSVHRWTSTWDLSSSVCTAGPQPGTCPGQCALLDLNLGPAQLSVHRWTSTAR